GMIRPGPGRRGRPTAGRRAGLSQEGQGRRRVRAARSQDGEGPGRGGRPRGASKSADSVMAATRAVTCTTVVELAGGPGRDRGQRRTAPPSQRDGGSGTDLTKAGGEDPCPWRSGGTAGEQAGARRDQASPGRSHSTPRAR